MFEVASVESLEGVRERGSVGDVGGDDREHLTLTSQRSCRLASSLVSIPPKNS